MKSDFTSTKQDLEENMINNIKETNTFLWSSLDLLISVSINDRFNKLRNLLTLFCTEKFHTVQEYSNTEERITEDTD